jgi:hypothetical protein
MDADQADDIGLSAEERVRLQFQLENCSTTKKHRRAAVAAAVRRSRRKTGGRRKDPNRPHPDSDRFIAGEMFDYAERLHHLHHPTAKTAKTQSDAIRRCIALDGNDHQPCSSTACSRCRQEMAHAGRELGELMVQKNLAGIHRDRIRAATILLSANPIGGDPPDPIVIADDFRHHMKIIRNQAEERNVTFLLLPEFEIVTPLEIIQNQHMRAYVDSALPNWIQSDRILIAHLHGLIVLPDDDQKSLLAVLQKEYPAPYAIVLRLFNHQEMGRAISQWMQYSSTQEDRHNVPVRTGRNFTRLYSAFDFLLIDQILEQLANDESIFEFSPTLSMFINDENLWTWDEILEDLREISEIRPIPQPIIYVYHYWLPRRVYQFGGVLLEISSYVKPCRHAPFWPRGPP